MGCSRHEAGWVVWKEGFECYRNGVSKLVLLDSIPNAEDEITAWAQNPTCLGESL
jgi:hypothetical protein